MPDFYRLSDIRTLLQAGMNRPVSRQLACKYSRRQDFPEPVATVGLTVPERIWSSDVIMEWITNLLDSLGIREQAEGKDASTAPATARDAAIYGFIRAKGGIRRDPAYWDSNLSAKENRRHYRYLDRKHGGQALDDIATEIAGAFPDSGIVDADTLYEWLGGK